MTTADEKTAQRAHFRQLCRVLWQKPTSRAALMVGAGFSCNARPISPSVGSFPSWQSLGRTILADLNVKSPDHSRHCLEDDSDIDVLRIADEYEAQFGRVSLENLVRRSIPDSLHEPANLHSELLRLPWSDVFTTNFDTLLERTRLTSRIYRPVVNFEQLTHTPSPRVIKLHGSLAPGSPLILTREDYRTYSKEFAPFVNTVRQSLLENSLVLIGFSANDPNFLEWIGWIRDELRERHAPIYWVGRSSFSIAQTLLLRKRGITVLDLLTLAPELPAASNPYETHLAWFCRHLDLARPRSPLSWPFPARTDSTNAPAQKDSNGSLDTAEPPPVADEPRTTSPLSDSAAGATLDRWRHERLTYPGWLVAPVSVRDGIWRSTERWIDPLLQYATECPIHERLAILREISWRLDLVMMPLATRWVPALAAALDASVEGSDSPSPTETTVASFEIAFALLRSYREDYREEQWSDLNAILESRVVDNAQFVGRWHYETALWHVWNLNRPSAHRALDRWAPEHPQASLRKAGLLLELDRAEDARTLLRSAIQELRDLQTRNESPDYRLLSIEGWSLYVLRQCEFRIDWDGALQRQTEYSARWDELKKWDCSPWPNLEYFERVISKTPPKQTTGRHRRRAFDPWQRRTSVVLMGRPIAAWLPALAYTRLYEVVGRPMRVGSGSSDETLVNAVRWWRDFTEFWSPSLLMRAGDLKGLTESGLLDRVSVATTRPELVRRLSRWLMDALDREIRTGIDDVGPKPIDPDFVATLMEALSRLTIGLEDAVLRQMVDRIQLLYRHTHLPSHSDFFEAREAWLYRVYSALSDRGLYELLPTILRFPLHDYAPGEATKKWDRRFCDMHGFPTERVRRVKKDRATSKQIVDCVDWLFERTNDPDPVAAIAATDRLILAFASGIMRKRDVNRLEGVIWRGTEEDWRNVILRFHSAFLFTLPRPSTVKLGSALKEMARVDASKEPRDGIVIGSRPFQRASAATAPPFRLPRELYGEVEWSREEALEMWEAGQRWWVAHRKYLSTSARTVSLGIGDVEATVRDIGTFVWRAVFPVLDARDEEEWDGLVRFFSDTRSSGVSLPTAEMHMLSWRPDMEQRVAGAIAAALDSEDVGTVSAASRSVRHCTGLYEQGRSEFAPTRLIELLARRVAFRRTPDLMECMDDLAYVIFHFPGSVGRDITHLLVASLKSWIASLWPLDGGDGDFPQEARPELQALLCSLSEAMAEWWKAQCPDEAEPDEMAQIRKLCADSPLPEVRRSVKSWRFTP